MKSSLFITKCKFHKYEKTHTNYKKIKKSKGKMKKKYKIYIN